SSAACWASVPGMEIEVEAVEEVLSVAPPTAASTTIHSRATSPRRRKAKRPSRYSHVAISNGLLVIRRGQGRFRYPERRCSVVTRWAGQRRRAQGTPRL